LVQEIALTTYSNAGNLGWVLVLDSENICRKYFLDH